MHFRLLYLTLFTCPALSHAHDSIPPKIPDKFLGQVQHKAQRLEKSADRRLEKSLNLYLKQERLMKQKLALIDPGKAERIFNGAIGKLEQYKAGLKNKAIALLPVGNSIGNSYVDSLAGSLTFMKDAKGMVGANGAKLTSALDNVQALKGKLQQSADIEKFIAAHKEQLKVQLAQYSNMLPNLKAINQEYYYYHAQVQEYLGVFRDPKKAEQKAMVLLQKLPAYNDFIKKNSIIAGLFNLGSNYDPAQLMEGQQTRTLVEPMIQGAMGSSPTARQAISAQIQQARSKMDELKKKLPTGGGNAADMPDFQPKPLKTKTFFERVEPGGNIQFQKSNTYFPTTAELAGQLAYKLNPKSNIGVGLSYSVGMGSSWEHIVFSHRGFGLRSFLSYKVKGGWYANGGLEANKVMANATATNYTKKWDGWWRSALLGLSKQYKVSAKLKGNIMLLYDFWPTQNIPQNRFKIRFGYTR